MPWLKSINIEYELLPRQHRYTYFKKTAWTNIRIYWIHIKDIREIGENTKYYYNLELTLNKRYG